MHHARLSKSTRLQRVARLLSDGKLYSTRQIIRAARVCAVNSVVAELRENGKHIECARIGKNWFYRMAS